MTNEQAQFPISLGRQTGFSMYVVQETRSSIDLAYLQAACMNFRYFYRPDITYTVRRTDTRTYLNRFRILCLSKIYILRGICGACYWVLQTFWQNEYTLMSRWREYKEQYSAFKRTSYLQGIVLYSEFLEPLLISVCGKLDRVRELKRQYPK